MLAPVSTLMADRFKGILSGKIRHTLISSALAVSMGLGNIAYAAGEYGLSSGAEKKLEALRAVAKKEGISFRVTEGYRSQKSQNALYAQGRTKPGKQVTWTTNSRHTTRDAFDIAVEKEGGVTWKASDYSRVGELGKSVGLDWGGDWKRKDLVHFQLPSAKAGIKTSRFIQVRQTADYVAGLTESDPIYRKTVSNMLYETAIHESGGLAYNKQVWGKGKASSIFQIEPTTAEYLVRWAQKHPKAMGVLETTSGKNAFQLTSMSKDSLSTMLSENERFAAGMARVKYLSAPGKIPSTVEARAEYWGKYYQGRSDPNKINQFVEHNKAFQDQAAKNIQKHRTKVPPTGGLVNKALHEGKTSSKMGTASYKAVKFMRSLIKR